MLNVSDQLPFKDRLQVLEDFVQRLKESGYSRQQARHVISSELINYEKRRVRAEAVGNPIHRSLKEMCEGRDVKKIIEKTSWFLDKESDDDLEAPKPFQGAGKRRFRHRRHLTPSEKAQQPYSVLMVPRTAGGTLLK